jgi:hypothetical protein
VSRRVADSQGPGLANSLEADLLSSNVRILSEVNRHQHNRSFVTTEIGEPPNSRAPIRPKGPAIRIKS